MAGLERIFDIQGYSGGESDDMFKGPKDSFYSGENIEVRKNLNGVQLSSKLVDTGWTFTGNITCMVNLEDLGIGTGVLYCTDAGEVCVGSQVRHTWTAGGNWNIVVAIGTLNLSGTYYVYYVTKDINGVRKIHKSTADITSTFTQSYKTLDTGGEGINAVVLDNGNTLLIGADNIVFSMDSTETVTTKLTLRTKEYIVGLTRFQDTYKVYANLGNSGIQYIWDGNELVPNDRQVWQNQPILGIQNDGAYDYAILGFNSSYSDLYLISGPQKQELRVNLEASPTSRILDGKMSIREGILYISGGKTGESDNYGVYTYGNYFPGTAKSLVQSYSLNSVFNFHTHTSTISYLGNGNKIYKVDHNNPPSTNGYALSGFVTSLVDQGNLWEEKLLNKIKVGYKLLDGTSIKISCRTSLLSGDWKLLKTLTYAEHGSKKGYTITKNEFASLNVGVFNEIQLKAELTTTNTPSTATPILYRVTVFMEVVNQN